MFCKYCGSEIDDNSAFCTKCGKSQNSREKRHVIDKKKMCIIFIPVIIILIIFIAILYKNMTEIVVIDKIEAGSEVHISSIVRAKSPNATIALKGEVDTGRLGTYNIKCIISNGIFKSKKNVKVSVIDTKAPEIEGPEQVVLSVGENFDVEKLYKVTDFEDYLEKKITVSPDLDINKEHRKEYTLSVSDSSGNIGEKTVLIGVLKLSEDEKKVQNVIYQYIEDGYSKESIAPYACIMKTTGKKGISDYVRIGKEDIIYAIYSSGEISEVTATDCGGKAVYETLVYAILMQGDMVSTDKMFK